MKKVFNKRIFLVIFVFIIQISANFSDYESVFEDNQYLVEGILQVLPADLNNDHNEELILAGKNYIAREVFLYWLTVDKEFKPVIQWQSDNLFEERSIIWVVSGKFTTARNQLLAFSNSQYYLFQFENNQVNLLKQEKHSLQLLNITSGDVDGDGQSEVTIACIGEITSKIYNGIIQVWKFKDDKMELLAESNLIGNIRGIAAGDIDQDGRDEIFVDEALKFAPGNMHVFRYNANKLTESFKLKKATKGPVYGMQVKTFPEGVQLITATATGFINFFKWENNALKLTGSEINLERDIMSFTVTDLNNDQVPELIVAEYPQALVILTK